LIGLAERRRKRKGNPLSRENVREPALAKRDSQRFQVYRYVQRAEAGDMMRSRFCSSGFVTENPTDSPEA
jgi:hypothetical protein